MRHLYIGEQIDSTVLKLIAVYLIVFGFIVAFLVTPILALLFKTPVTHAMYLWLTVLSLLFSMLLSIKILSAPLTEQQDVVKRLTKERANLALLDITWQSKLTMVFYYLAHVFILTVLYLSVQEIIQTDTKSLKNIYLLYGCNIIYYMVCAVVKRAEYRKIVSQLDSFSKTSVGK